MSVSFLKHIAIEIPQVDKVAAKDFYTAFGLDSVGDDSLLEFRCKDRKYSSMYLLPVEGRKRLHHLAMGATESGLNKVKAEVLARNIELLDAPDGFSNSGIWFKSPHGLLFNVEVCEAEPAVKPEAPFLINSTGNYCRINAPALKAKSKIPDVTPRKLGHVLTFTPDVDESILFAIEVLGMRLSDRAQDVVAFMHCQGGSDHHVIAFVKSDDIGIHHASFMTATPDEVGLGGSRMIEKGYKKGWGFGRHAIGSNFFYYVQDPWGSFLEYYCDIDYISDSQTWQASDWPLEDSLHTWGPNPPEDFAHNYELD